MTIDNIGNSIFFMMGMILLGLYHQYINHHGIHRFTRKVKYLPIREKILHCIILGTFLNSCWAFIEGMGII